MHEVIERFLRYAKIDTRSDETTGTTPSTAKQQDLARLLAKELTALGAKDVFHDEEHCYVYAVIPPHPDAKSVQKLGLIAHMDTSPEVTGTGVNPRIVEGYDGGEIVLNREQKVVLSPKDFPDLLRHKGEDLIVTDGTTLLGADDKAGIAEIMTCVHRLLTDTSIVHGEIRICFTPDEEIGEGTDHIDLKRFGADVAYTVDGGRLGELEYENFNAAELQLTIHGRSVHPGTAKGQMINATLIAHEFHAMLPVQENPMYTEGREGFFHLNQMRGTVEKAVVHYIIRDHDRDLFEKKKELIHQIASFLNAKYGEGTVEVLMEDVYYNMIEQIRPHMDLIEFARKAMEAHGVTPIEHPIRGGTDGARLSFLGVPCPNLCTGGYNYHGRYEYASVQEMVKTTEILVTLCGLFADRVASA